MSARLGFDRAIRQLISPVFHHAQTHNPEPGWWYIAYSVFTSVFFNYW